jgi:HAE1 family hydrophobic/amphiphilic exporter-1
MDYEISYDVSKFLDASIEKVIHTLIEAFILVGLVVFLFLGDWRSTIIALCQYRWLELLFSCNSSIFHNLITLFALVLAIGSSSMMLL